jgi:hypothetical protein
MSKKNLAKLSIMRSASQAVQFLEALRPGGPWWLNAFPPERGGGVVGELMTDAAEIDRFIETHNGKRNIYYTLNALRGTAAYENLIQRLVSHTRFNPRRHELSDAAYHRMEAIQRRLFELKQVGASISEGFAEYIGKLEGITGNLTLILHYAQYPDDKQPRNISAETVEKVERLLLEFILPHAIAFYRSLAQKSNNGEAIQKIASWLLTSKRERFVANAPTPSAAGPRGILGRQSTSKISKKSKACLQPSTPPHNRQPRP